MQNIYLPIKKILTQEKILSRFPKRTPADMYVWIIRHRQELQERLKTEPSIQDVVQDLSKKYGQNKTERVFYILKRLFGLFKK